MYVFLIGDFNPALDQYIDFISKDSASENSIRELETTWNDIYETATAASKKMITNLPAEAYKNAWDSAATLYQNIASAAKILSNFDTNNDGEYSDAELLKGLNNAKDTLSSLNLEEFSQYYADVLHNEESKKTTSNNSNSSNNSNNSNNSYNSSSNSSNSSTPASITPEKTATCNYCNGSGRVDGETCPWCNGSGKTYDNYFNDIIG